MIYYYNDLVTLIKSHFGVVARSTWLTLFCVIYSRAAELVSNCRSVNTRHTADILEL